MAAPQIWQAIHLVAAENVCYLQSTDKYALLLRTLLKELIMQFDPQHFWQVHRGTIVNLRQIVSAHHDLLNKVTLTLRDRSGKDRGQPQLCASVPAEVRISGSGCGISFNLTVETVRIYPPNLMAPDQPE